MHVVDCAGVGVPDGTAVEVAAGTVGCSPGPVGEECFFWLQPVNRLNITIVINKIINTGFFIYCLDFYLILIINPPGFN